MKSTEVTTRIPLNLQFFAEDPATTDPAAPVGALNDPEPTKEEGKEPQNEPEPQYTVEGLLSQLAEQKAAMTKMKSDYDKLMKSEGDMRKKLNAKLSAEEQAAQAKAEEENATKEHLAEVERKLALIEATNRYLKMGMSEELANETATAEVDENRDLVNLNIAKYQSEWQKAKEAEIRQQYLDQMPMPQSGNSSEVDYSKQYNEALAQGDTNNVILAVLEQAKATGALNV